jgi:hypothetical protein
MALHPMKAKVPAKAVIKFCDIKSRCWVYYVQDDIAPYCKFCQQDSRVSRIGANLNDGPSIDAC